MALVHPRSGLAVKQGVTVLNAPGTIDAGYRGEIKVPLINLDPERAVTFHPGDRIAQLVIQRYVEAKFIEAQTLPDPTARNVASDQPALRPDGTAIHKDEDVSGCGTNAAGYIRHMVIRGYYRVHSKRGGAK